MKFRQHIPNACYDPDVNPIECEFNNKEELLNIPWINSWNFDAYFDHFYILHYHDDVYLLIAKYHYGPNLPSKWVLGYLSGDGVKDLGIPEHNNES
jgi:hypothetical protein